MSSHVRDDFKPGMRVKQDPDAPCTDKWAVDGKGYCYQEVADTPGTVKCVIPGEGYKYPIAVSIDAREFPMPFAPEELLILED